MPRRAALALGSAQQPGHVRVVDAAGHHHVRNRTIEAAPAHGPRAANRIAEPIGRHLAIDVAPVQAELPVDRLDLHHRRVFRRRHGERAGQGVQKVMGHGVLRFHSVTEQPMPCSSNTGEPLWPAAQ